jgi:hypothetical protein
MLLPSIGGVILRLQPIHFESIPLCLHHETSINDNFICFTPIRGLIPGETGIGAGAN